MLKEWVQIATIIDIQLKDDKQQGINVIQPPTDKIFTHYMPNQKGEPSDLLLIMQYYPDNDSVKLMFPCNADDEYREVEKENKLPRIYPQIPINASINPLTAGISQAALNAFLGNAYLDELSNMAGSNLGPVKIEQIINGVVHPITKETITKYKRIIANPLLKDDWMMGIYKKLGRLAQCHDETGTDD